jgi:hypothetical protein
MCIKTEAIGKLAYGVLKKNQTSEQTIIFISHFFNTVLVDSDQRTRQEVPKLKVHTLNIAVSTSSRGRHFSILHQVQTGSKYYPAPWTFHSIDNVVEK